MRLLGDGLLDLSLIRVLGFGHGKRGYRVSGRVSGVGKRGCGDVGKRGVGCRVLGRG